MLLCYYYSWPAAIGQFKPSLFAQETIPSEGWNGNDTLINNVLWYMMFKSVAVDLTVHSYRKRAIHNTCLRQNLIEDGAISGFSRQKSVPE